MKTIRYRYIKIKEGNSCIYKIQRRTWLGWETSQDYEFYIRDDIEDKSRKLARKRMMQALNLREDSTKLIEYPMLKIS